MSRILSKLKGILMFPINYFRLMSTYIGDCNQYLKYSLGGYGANTRQDRLIGNILLTIHALEKGLSFRSKKPNWGGQKSYALCRNLETYITLYGEDQYFNLGVSVLEQYLKDEYSLKEDRLKEKIKCLVKKRTVTPVSSGIKHITVPPEFDKGAIEEFFSTRRSVREFSEKTISAEEIQSALNIAKMTPTACNRQSSRVYAYRDKKLIKAILDVQFGSQGWCENADTVFVITGNQSFFGGIYEREELYIDGGLFAMNFVWGLHMNHIASCFKMFVRPPKLQKKFQALLNIPANEVPIVLIFAGHYREDDVVSPCSHRFNITLKTGANS